ncbi:MAG: hypothetical protein HYR92_02585 [Burkholderiales bacterium]|nr:hypothetical protein [Burkholderiales bacterium]
MITQFAFAICLLTAVYFVLLGVLSLLKPTIARRFLLGFARDARTHYLELGLRLMVGVALIVAAPTMQYSAIFHSFGWIILLSTAVLVLLPWRWHQKFAQRFVPLALPYLSLIGLISALFGIGLILALPVF